MHKFLLCVSLLALGALSGCDLLNPSSNETPNSPGSPPPIDPDPVVGAERFSIMPGPYYPFAELENVVRDKLGSGYKIADWLDLQSQSDQLERFLDAIGIARGESYFVLWNGQAHPDKVAASGLSAQHPGPAAFRYLVYRGPKHELETHFEDLVIVDDSLHPRLVLYRTWNRTGNILVTQQP